MSLVMYILSSTVGFLTLPWAMIGEVFPFRIRGPASGFTTCMAYVFSFVILKVYPETKHLWGNHGLFTFYSTMSLAGTICMYVYLPETRNRTLQQIEEHFRGKN
jgi:sugar phosphate permease